MTGASSIEWTDASWNPTSGCDRISPGCDNCYALRMAARLKLMGSARYQNDGDERTSGPGFALTVHDDALDWPLHQQKPKRIFVNSMSDLFHEEVPQEFIARVWSVMARCPQHVFQILTKRPQRMRHLLGQDASFWASFWRSGVHEATGLDVNHLPLHNVWLGLSIENDRYAFRANYLRQTRANVRFLSLEPLLGPLPSLKLDGIDWVIVGGESGPGARPMNPEWVRDIRDRCTELGVPFFFKQWGTWVPYENDAQPPFLESQHGDFIDGHHLPADLTEENRPTQGWWWPGDDDVVYRRVGKAAAGRQLDGQTHDEFPWTKLPELRS